MRLGLAALAVFSAASLAAAQPASAPPASAGRAQRLERLAEALGRQHYLRTLCRGPDDQTWRTRMSRLLEIEADANAARLEQAFNRGFTALTARVPACGPTARAEAVANARRGAEIASGL